MYMQFDYNARTETRRNFFLYQTVSFTYVIDLITQYMAWCDIDLLHTLLALCYGNSVEDTPHQKPVLGIFDILFAVI